MDELSKKSKLLADKLQSLFNDLVINISELYCLFLSPDQTKSIPIETLMYGGDELCMVIPAWLSGAVYKTLNNLKSEDGLTFSTGILICHYKKPIRETKNLAEALCNFAKQDNSDKNMISQLILESQYVSPYELGKSFATFSNLQEADFHKLSTRSSLESFLANIVQLKIDQSIPRSHIADLLDVLIDEKIEWEKIKETVLSKYPAAEQQLKALLNKKQYLNSADNPVPALFWGYQLWDYLPATPYFEAENAGEGA
jgi:hypothetical protein